jgi:hypothetical protein
MHWLKVDSAAGGKRRRRRRENGECCREQISLMDIDPKLSRPLLRVATITRRLTHTSLNAAAIAQHLKALYASPSSRCSCCQQLWNWGELKKKILAAPFLYVCHASIDDKDGRGHCFVTTTTAAAAEAATTRMSRGFTDIRYVQIYRHAPPTTSRRRCCCCCCGA